MQVSTGSMADFSGVLVGREQKSGQKYVQLMFHTSEGIRLSLSRNAKMVQSLTIGETYTVKGLQRKIGKYSFVQEPSAMPVKRSKGLLGGRKKLFAVIVVAVMIFAVAGVVTAMSITGGSADKLSAESVQTAAKKPSRVISTVSTNQAAPAATQPAADAPRVANTVRSRPTGVTVQANRAQPAPATAAVYEPPAASTQTEAATNTANTEESGASGARSQPSDTSNPAGSSGDSAQDTPSQTKPDHQESGSTAPINPDDTTAAAGNTE